MSDKFFVGFCNIDLHIHNCNSLKEKRRVIASLKEKLKNNYNVAICEFGNLSLWQRAQFGVVTCSNDRILVDSTLKAVADYIQKVPAVTLLNFESQIT